MKIAFLGDIHGYLPALEQALQSCAQLGIQKIIGLGDYIDGYPANDECIKLIRQTFTASVFGNHDQSHGYETSENAQRWLAQLPEKVEIEGVLITHSSPRTKWSGESIRSAARAWSCFVDEQFQFCIVGHAHRPRLYQYCPDLIADCKEWQANSGPWKLMDDQRYLFVNPSLAYNRDTQTQPGFSTFDSETRTLEIHYLNLPPLFDWNNHAEQRAHKVDL